MRAEYLDATSPAICHHTCRIALVGFEEKDHSARLEALMRRIWHGRWPDHQRCRASDVHSWAQTLLSETCASVRLEEIPVNLVIRPVLPPDALLSLGALPCTSERVLLIIQNLHQQNQY